MTFRTWIVAAIPVVLISLLCGIYAAAPQFYLEHVLQGERREHQAVEIVTFTSALTGGILLLWSAWRLFRTQRRPSNLWDLGGVGIIGLIALAAIFFAGEEISWGQSYFGWETPEEYLEVSIETNIHNRQDIPFSVQGLGSLFLICVFIIFPLVWWLRGPHREGGGLTLPPSWRPAVPEGPVIFTIALAFIWKEQKNIYLSIVGDEQAAESDFYMQFMEQFNEHKEMLVAIALLMYGIYRVKAVRAAA